MFECSIIHLDCRWFSGKSGMHGQIAAVPPHPTAQIGCGEQYLTNLETIHRNLVTSQHPQRLLPLQRPLSANHDVAPDSRSCGMRRKHGY